MQAIANDAQQVAAANGGQQGDGQGAQPGGNKNQGNMQGGNGVGPWGRGNGPPGPANGGGGGVAMGNNRPPPEVAPFQVKNETDISDKNEKGKVLASTFVKAGSIKGDADVERLNAFLESLGLPKPDMGPLAKGKAKVDLSFSGPWSGFAAPQVAGVVRTQGQTRAAIQ